MTPDIKNTKAFKWLHKSAPQLAARVLDIRHEVSLWLPYVIQTFPHYPQHGVEHSDRIVAQLSELLFTKKPSVNLSPSEIYCLLCSAYIHDIGMVISPLDIAALLESENWKAYISKGGKGHEAYLHYQTAKHGSSSEKDSFLTGRFLRELIAEFVRRTHHERAPCVLEMHPYLQRLVDMNDPVASETISMICVGHGLSESELSDDLKFPEERDVLNHKVNVRFMARLLRIGDLLDMDAERAAPIAEIAARALPKEAEPHWKQYSRKVHELISPNVIEFRFECQDQETHRVLRDWLGWLEAEIRATGLSQMHARRHAEWRAPRCTVKSCATISSKKNQSAETIIISPANNATYSFHEWRLEIDQEKILQRLIFDVYNNLDSFVRELLQNALDATRCRMYHDFINNGSGRQAPAYPTQFPASFRNRYPLKLSISSEKISTEDVTGEQWVFTIEDRGTGMDEHIITKYFLQIGRSYYQSDEFRENFRFSPTSRFGIGFLSVFAVSNDITVETAMRPTGNSTESTGIKLRLKGPRNYLLTEPWIPFPERPIKERHGTRIRVILNSPPTGGITELTRKLCVATEIPILVLEDNKEHIIYHKPQVDNKCLAPSQIDKTGKFIQRVFNINEDGIEGEIYLCAYVDKLGEGWCDCWSNKIDLGGQRIDTPPKLPPSRLALHGIDTGTSYYTPEKSIWRHRIDIRKSASISLSRQLESQNTAKIFDGANKEYGERDISKLASDAMEKVATKIVHDHLSTTPRAKTWNAPYYISRVLSEAPVDSTFQINYPGTTILWRKGEATYHSVQELMRIENIIIASWTKVYTNEKRIRTKLSAQQAKSPILSVKDVPLFAGEIVHNHVLAMKPISLRKNNDLWLLEMSSAPTAKGLQCAAANQPWWFFDFEDDRLTCVVLDTPNQFGSKIKILNLKNPMIKWIKNTYENSESSNESIHDAIKTTWMKFCDAPYQSKEILARWSNSDVPKTFRPDLESMIYKQRYESSEGLKSLYIERQK